MRRGFVVSALLYPLLLLFLSLIMGLLSMNMTRKKILENMKNEISDRLFENSNCDCKSIEETIEEYEKKVKEIEEEIRYR